MDFIKATISSNTYFYWDTWWYIRVTENHWFCKLSAAFCLLLWSNTICVPVGCYIMTVYVLYDYSRHLQNHQTSPYFCWHFDAVSKPIKPGLNTYTDSKVHGANMGPTWVMLYPGGPHIGPWTLLSGYILFLRWRPDWRYSLCGFKTPLCF